MPNGASWIGRRGVLAPGNSHFGGGHRTRAGPGCFCGGVGGWGACPSGDYTTFGLETTASPHQEEDRLRASMSYPGPHSQLVSVKSENELGALGKTGKEQQKSEWQAAAPFLKEVCHPSQGSLGLPRPLLPYPTPSSLRGVLHRS